MNLYSRAHKHRGDSILLYSLSSYSCSSGPDSAITLRVISVSSTTSISPYYSLAPSPPLCVSVSRILFLPLTTNQRGLRQYALVCLLVCVCVRVCSLAKLISQGLIPSNYTQRTHRPDQHLSYLTKSEIFLSLDIALFVLLSFFFRRLGCPNVPNRYSASPLQSDHADSYCLHCRKGDNDL